MIEVEDLVVRYRDQVALDGASLRVADGEFVLVGGPSGCGKSTLARVLAGLIPAVIDASLGGRVRVARLDPTRASRAELATRSLATPRGPRAGAR